MSAPRWFQRRRVGLGWRPASWQGWVLTALAVAAVVAVITSLRGSSARVPLTILVVSVYAVVALATGGSKAPAVASLDEPSSEPRPEPAGAAAEQREALRGLASARPAARSD